MEDPALILLNSLSHFLPRHFTLLYTIAFVLNFIFQKASTQLQYMKKCYIYSEHSYDNSNVLY